MSVSTKEEREQEAKNQAHKKGAFILAFGLIFIFLSFYGYQILLTDNVLVNKEDKVLIIPSGSKFEDVVEILEKEDFLHDRLSFMFLSKLLGYRDHIKPGRYELTKNTSNYKLLKKLKGGYQDPVKLTIINFRTKEELVKRITKKLEIDSTTLFKALENNILLAKYGFADSTIMALFIPNTYQVYWTATSEDILDLFFKEYRLFWTEERKSKASSISLTPIETIIMASIIEAETQKNDEKTRIAGVYMNRLKAGQRLQADPTLIFATRDFTAKRVNEYHRYFKSPYNTYRRAGLPPGPINTPSISSIEAVLNYEKHPYFFFCAKPDLSGYHLFSKNFEEHLGVAQKYWKSLDKENIH